MPQVAPLEVNALANSMEEMRRNLLTLTDSLRRREAELLGQFCGDMLRLMRLIDNLLESVRIEAGQLAIRSQQVELPVVQADRLLAHIWGARGGGDRQLLKQLVHRLRQKLGDNAERPRWLETIPNGGYRLRN